MQQMKKKPDDSLIASHEMLELIPTKYNSQNEDKLSKKLFEIETVFKSQDKEKIVTAFLELKELLKNKNNQATILEFYGNNNHFWPAFYRYMELDKAERIFYEAGNAVIAFLIDYDYNIMKNILENGDRMAVIHMFRLKDRAYRIKPSVGCSEKMTKYGQLTKSYFSKALLGGAKDVGRADIILSALASRGKLELFWGTVEKEQKNNFSKFLNLAGEKHSWFYAFLAADCLSGDMTHYANALVEMKKKFDKGEFDGVAMMSIAAFLGEIPPPELNSFNDYLTALKTVPEFIWFSITNAGFIYDMTKLIMKVKKDIDKTDVNYTTTLGLSLISNSISEDVKKLGLVIISQVYNYDYWRLGGEAQNIDEIAKYLAKKDCFSSFIEKEKRSGKFGDLNDFLNKSKNEKSLRNGAEIVLKAFEIRGVK